MTSARIGIKTTTVSRPIRLRNSVRVIPGAAQILFMPVYSVGNASHQ
ncbi:MAG: hypothetical protein LH702_30480 [Phormidesmis sp. CAN_BIN44]|nr:hypothetical protein [Phormidesmis sp. CAN_BIN44]